MPNAALIELCRKNNIKLTELRLDVLSILFAKRKAMRAYEILAKLKKIRLSAEPPTVYRVLDYLIAMKLVHRIDSQNTFICCPSLLDQQQPHKAILLFCNNCKQIFEYQDKALALAITAFSKRNSISVDDSLIEVKGYCQKCPP